MSILNDRTAWNQATKDQRAVVVTALLERELKETFDYQGMEVYQCAGIINHVARFVHRPTQMIFHLLPGEPDYSIGIANKHLVLINSVYAVDLKENSTHSISISPFLISQYLITEQAWKVFDGPSLFRTFGDDYPIDAVERVDVEQWAQRAGLYLPSEMEWEYACKAGGETIFYWGNKPNLDYAWTKENTDFGPDDYRTFRADEQKLSNAFGLLGMIGNLGEWVEDDAYHFGRAYTTQKAYKTGSNRADGILRGGWNNYDWKFNRSTSRIQCGSGDTGCSARAVFRWT